MNAEREFGGHSLVMKTRVELANAIFEYLQIFHNRRRRHSALGMVSPVEYEMNQAPLTAA